MRNAKAQCSRYYRRDTFTTVVYTCRGGGPSVLESCRNIRRRGAVGNVGKSSYVNPDIIAAAAVTTFFGDTAVKRYVVPGIYLWGY